MSTVQIEAATVLEVVEEGIARLKEGDARALLVDPLFTGTLNQALLDMDESREEYRRRVIEAVPENLRSMADWVFRCEMPDDVWRGGEF